jgi:hypothetical protein
MTMNTKGIRGEGRDSRCSRGLGAEENAENVMKEDDAADKTEILMTAKSEIRGESFGCETRGLRFHNVKKLLEASRDQLVDLHAAVLQLLWAAFQKGEEACQILLLPYRLLLLPLFHEVVVEVRLRPSLLLLLFLLEVEAVEEDQAPLNTE